MKLAVFLSLLLVLMFGTVSADQDTESQAAGSTDRFELVEHDFMRDGKPFELYIKLDRFTGQTWKLDGSVEMRWKPIFEQKESEKPVAGGVPRYVLYAHKITKEGKDQEVYLRFDGQTGKTWSWSGTEPGWVVVNQDK